MRTINSTAFETIKSLGDSVKTLPIYANNGVYTSPYTEIPMETSSDVDLGLTMYDCEDIAFCNTKEFSRTGQYFIKHGVYTKAHPKYDSKEYNAFWDEEERRCKEGLTLPGKLIKDVDGQYKLQQIHITGEHYGYLNYAEIKRSKEFQEKKGVLYTAKGEAINKIESKSAKKEFSLPDFWDGDYYFFKAIELCEAIGKHLVIGKARRKGYSYKNGWLVANKANFERRSNSVVGAYDAKSLFEDGTMNKVLNYLDFINKHTDWAKRRIHSTLEHIELGFRYTGDPVKRGFLSNIYTAVLRSDPGGMRGKDATLLLLEEAGKCPNLRTVLEGTLKSLSDGIWTTGLMIVFGTGGGDDNLWEGFEDLFYETYAKNFVSFHNVWDDDMIGTGCGYFHGSFMSKPGLIDIHGNSDIQGSIKFDDWEKSKVLHDPTKVNAHEMEEPRKPSEAFSRATNNIFPAKLIDEQLRRVQRDPTLQGIGREGMFTRDEKGIKFINRLLADEEQAKLIPPAIKNFPIQPTDDVRGCWILYEQPYKDKETGKIPDNLYSAWNDPYGISKEKEYINVKDSLGCTFIYEHANSFTHTKGDRIVAVFVGRRENTEDYDDEMFNGVQYYNAKLLYENDRGDVMSNAVKRGLLHLLKEETTFQHNKEISGGGQGRKRGISIAGNSQRKLTGVVYLKKWLIEERGLDKNGNKLLNLHYIYDVPFLKELLKYDGKRNTDRVSCGIVGMFDIRETLFKHIVPEQPRTNVIEDSYFLNPFE